MSTVFVTQENSRLNYSDAERFGNIVFLTAREYTASPNSLHNKELIAGISETLTDFYMQTDYLLLSGDPIIAALAFYSIVSTYYLKGSNQACKLNLLKWDALNRRYNKIGLEIGVQGI